MALTYKDAGVDIHAGDALVDGIRPAAAATLRPEVISGVGGFGGLFRVPVDRYREPVLVSGTDGVGTKLMLAFESGRHHTVGIDLVAMSVNDVLTSGAEPLFFLDYFATSRLQIDQARQVITGIAEGCRQAGCTLLGGETAEMPGFYQPGHYDLAGFCVGVVERSEIVNGSGVAAGDVILGLASSGLHSNGYSLARRILQTARLNLNDSPDGLGGKTILDLILEPTRIYVTAIRELLQSVTVKAMAHITGSGLPGNVPRAFPNGTVAHLFERSWVRPQIFDFLAAAGSVARDEMFSTFNMGIGYVVVVSPAEASSAVSKLQELGTTCWHIGEVREGRSDQEASVVIHP